VSNLPGPVKEISYCGNSVEDILPIMSLGIGKAFVILGTYNNKIRIVINVDKAIEIDLKLLVQYMEEEMINIENNVD
jgi:hypothetical protein